jgi:hypothetical protein
MGSPRSDFVHFTGRRKPWFHGPPANVTKETRLDSDSHLWFYQLEQLNDELDMGLNFTGWATGKSRRPLLGMYPLYGAVLTSNTNLVGTEVEYGDDTIDDQSMNATSSHISVSPHEDGSLPTNGAGTGTTVTETASDHATLVAREARTSVAHNSTSSAGNATLAHTTNTKRRRRRRRQHLRSSAAVLNERTVSVSSGQEIA